METPRPPIRLLLCITELDVGGAEKALVAIATHIDRERFAPSVVVLAPRGAHEVLVHQLEDAAIPVTFLGVRRPWQALTLFIRLVSVMRRERPDVVLPFLFHANIAARFAAWFARIPVCLAGIRVAERECGWHVWLDRITQSLVRRYVCVSRDVATFVAHHHRVSESKIVVIPNGIELFQKIDQANATTRDETRSISTTPTRHRAIVVGRLHRQKGVDWLLTTAPFWLAEMPLWELVIVGDGPERPHLETQVAGEAFDDVRTRIKFLGWRSDAAALLAASDLLLLSSRWEGMPNVVLEAMAAGKPVLAAAVEGVPELLGEYAADQTFPPEDDEAFLTSLAILTQDADTMERLGEANRHRAMSLFTIARVVEAYERLLVDEGYAATG